MDWISITTFASARRTFYPLFIHGNFIFYSLFFGLVNSSKCWRLYSCFVSSSWEFPANTIETVQEAGLYAMPCCHLLRTISSNKPNETAKAIDNLVLLANLPCINPQPMNITETNKELPIRLRKISINAKPEQ